MTKLPPQNIDAEESILSGCLLFPDYASEFAGLLKSDDFYRSQNGIIFDAVCRLVEAKQPVDALTVCDKIKDRPFPGDKPPAQYISEIQNVPVPSSSEYYATLVRTAATARRAIAICQGSINAIFDNQPLTETINALQVKVLDLGAEAVDHFYTMEELTNMSIDRYESMCGGRKSSGLKTGYHILDKLTGGFSGSKLIIIAARPGVGKTAFMCNLIENIAKSGHKCGVFELEMDKEELEDRWFAALAGINTIRLTAGYKLESDEWEKVISVAGIKATWPVLVDDTGGITIAELKRRCRKMKSMGAEIIFIDQLSEIRGDKKKSVFEMNTDHVEELGALKKELRIPVVLLAQLNRDLEKRNADDKKPRLSDLKNTGMLEEKADMVLLGFRKGVYSDNPQDASHALWSLAKNRGGPTMDMEMVWIPKHARFENKASGAW